MRTPNNWLSIALGNMSTFIRGVTFPKGSRLESYENGTVAVATTKAAQQPGIEHDKLYFIPKSFVKRLEQFLLPNDIVISIANSLDLVGRVTFATKKDEGITWGAFLGVIRANPKLIYPYFLYSFLTTAETKQYFRKNARTTTNISNISSDSILSLQIPVPPLAEQKRIVKKIEELFGVIDEQVKRLEATQEALISYRQSILQQAFSGNLYKATEWDTVLFNDICTYIQRGKSPRYIDYSTLPVINQKCIRWNELQTQYLKYIDPAQFDTWTRERHVKPMDILWNSTGTGTIGRAYLYRGTEIKDAVVDSHVTIVRPDIKKVNPTFLFFYIQSPFVQDKIEKMQSGSTNQVELARKEIQNVVIALPSLAEQKAIVKKIETAFAFADKAQAAITDALEQAKQLKQSILKRAFEGKLVPQDPNDKPVNLTQLKKDKQK